MIQLFNAFKLNLINIYSCTCVCTSASACDHVSACMWKTEVTIYFIPSDKVSRWPGSLPVWIDQLPESLMDSPICAYLARGHRHMLLYPTFTWVLQHRHMLPYLTYPTVCWVLNMGIQVPMWAQHTSSQPSYLPSPIFCFSVSFKKDSVALSR